MPGLILHTSNQLDLLAQRLSEVVATPLESPFTPEIVVVPSIATRRWLSFQIAQNQGICANYHFPFLGDFVTSLVSQGSPEGAAERLSFEALIWKIDSLLQRSVGKKEFAQVTRYLRDRDPLKRFHLAIRLANLFDQYGAYRPEMLSSWVASGKKRSAEEAWQANLWRQLGQMPVFDHTLERLRAHGFDGVPNLDLPERVSVFAPANVPPAYLDLLFQLAREREIHLFVLRPSRAYRGDDPTPKQRARLGLTPSDSPTGNPLTTSWGRIDVELTDLLLEKEERLQTKVTTSSEQFREFKTATILGTLKGDITEGQSRGAVVGDASDAIPPIIVRPNDRSLGLHVCYSPMREVEILYDQLLDCFATMPGLRPRDILVMTPAIEEYAPFIRAVFQYPEEESKRIPYSLADRHPRSESPTIDTFLTLLDLPGSRYTASQIFGLFGSRSLRHRFHFTDDDLSQIRDWIQKTNIRWGIDGDHRKRLGLPDLNTNTWRHGLQRLLLGYAMEGKNRTPFEGILPHDEVEGEGAGLLGRFITAAEALFQLTESLEHPRPLADWAKPLTEIIDQFFDPRGEEEVRDVRFLRLIVDQLRTFLENGLSDGDVVFPVVRYYLDGQLARLEQRGNFFSTGVTFCALKPVRGIPARVVCLLGINDQIFPSRPQPTQFDLMAQRPRAGDPSARQDDRYSFLQAVLAAEERLLISYVGRSAIHNQEIPPSVVVSELLDYANQAFVFPGNQSAREFLLTEHPLQAFSPRYFTEPREDERLFGYSEANATASRTVHSAQPIEVQPFLAGPLPLSGEPSPNLELRDLINFWRHPSEYFVKNRLGLDLKDRGFSLEDEESFEPTPLALYPLRQELLTQELDGETLPIELFEARGILSSGVIGQLQLGSIRADIEKMAENVRQKIGNRKRDPAALIDLALPAYTLTGTIENLYGGQNVHFRPAKLQPKDYLRAWIEHLALCVGRKGEKTILIGRDGAVTFKPVSPAQEELQNLCDLYLLGLSQPLRFFPSTSMAFAGATVSGERDSFRMAREKWDPYRRQGEKDDPYFQRCFDGLDPFEDPFAEISLKVFKTMFEQMERDVP